MAQQSKNTLKAWFKKGLKPLENQFRDWIDSYWHKDDGIPMESVTDLVDTLNSMSIGVTPGTWVDCGSFNMDAGAFPAVGGTLEGGVPARGNTFEAVLTDPDTPVIIGGKQVNHGATMRALIDTPGNDPAHWKVTYA